MHKRKKQPLPGDWSAHHDEAAFLYLLYLNRYLQVGKLLIQAVFLGKRNANHQVAIKIEDYPILGLLKQTVMGQLGDVLQMIKVFITFAGNLCSK